MCDVVQCVDFQVIFRFHFELDNAGVCPACDRRVVESVLVENASPAVGVDLSAPHLLYGKEGARIFKRDYSCGCLLLGACDALALLLILDL